VASHVPRFGPVETEMFNKVFEPEALKATVPGISEVIEGADHLRSLNEEIGVLGQFQKNVAGFTQGRTAHRVAKLDTNIMVMLDHLHEAGCNCGKPLWGSDGHKLWFYAWLETDAGKTFDVRGTRALGA
jgi:hypothetical protein